MCDLPLGSGVVSLQRCSSAAHGAPSEGVFFGGGLCVGREPTVSPGPLGALQRETVIVKIEKKGFVAEKLRAYTYDTIDNCLKRTSQQPIPVKWGGREQRRPSTSPCAVTVDREATLSPDPLVAFRRDSLID